VEKNEFLGGTPVASLVPTMGYGGHDKERWVVGGFFKEFRNRMIGSGYLIPTKRKGWEPMNPEGYKLVAFNMLSEAGVDIQCGLWPLEIEMKDERLKTIVCDSKLGRCVIEANAFVDATGDGDIGYYAGCSFDVEDMEITGPACEPLLSVRQCEYRKDWRMVGVQGETRILENR
jgi:hypothetical protein